MADIVSRERLQPSLLDRLTDNAPEQKRESFDQQTLNMAQLRQAVLRDLGWLLNSTNLATTTELKSLPLVARSTVNYGIPGFAGLISSAARLTGVEAALAEAIRAFEPRIRPDTLRVRMRERTEDEPGPSVQFEIRGELWAYPAPQQIFVQTAIDLETRLAQVTDQRTRG
ncbi:MAG: type VI secretion system baseplate subunit TssE [Alphaproteobacteria bacterium]|nr:type VI secretion system baseplate subunit TssE [Alphaproteobacteria bacterium]